MRTAFFPGAELAAGPDAGLAAHARTAARYALLLARALGIDGENPLRTIERGALLHDIGKAAVPRAILFKRGPLTPFEREVVREHPEVGFQMVAGFGGLNEASEIVLCHHERWDGRGYPFGLAGEAIPLGARIFALADTLDAMTTDRAYRGARPFAEAMGEIGRLAGSQFDPEVTGVFLSLPAAFWRLAGAGAGVLFGPRTVH